VTPVLPKLKNRKIKIIYIKNFLKSMIAKIKKLKLKHEALSSNPSPTKNSNSNWALMADACNLTTWEAEIWRIEVQAQPR
jgi:hypothetical protein